MTKDPKIDAYIDRSSDFAKPILTHLRRLVQQTCPAVEEKMKWSFPHFDYKGEMMASMAGFKAHCAFSFWKAGIMKDPQNLLETGERTAMGNFGRITGMKNLPSDEVLTAYIKEAMRLNDEGVKLPSKPAKEKKKLSVPEELLDIFNQNDAVKTSFGKLSYSHQKEYIEWIDEAKRSETRKSRVEKTVGLVVEGKSLNYKYESK